MATTFGFAERFSLEGRSEEVSQLRAALERGARSILIVGPGGVGKTALANRLVEMASAGVFASRFDRRIQISAYLEQWNNVLVQAFSQLGGAGMAPKARPEEIESGILEASRKSRVLLSLDNLEDEQETAFYAFLKKWIETAHESVLIVTSRRVLIENRDQCFVLHLAGLAEKSARLVLLGSGLRTRFGDRRILSETKILEGNPLRLLWIRWLDPPSLSELRQLVSGLMEERLDKSISLERVVGGVASSTTHFLALGVVRDLRFEERLLGFFWDRLGGGSVESYLQTRNLLIEKGLLSASGDQVNVFRLSDEVHIQLYKSLAHRIGQARVATIHFYASEYYRRRFEESRGEALQFLDEFVYHTLESGNPGRAFEYVFREPILSRAHRAGLVVALQHVLERFYRAANEFPLLARIRILVELGHVANDLSEHEKCLALMEEAGSLLWSRIEEQGVRKEAYGLARRIWYYSAVSYSNIGYSNLCIESYLKIIASAGESNGWDQLSCLCLGYIGHDLKYRDLQMAIRYGAEALEISEMLDDLRLLAKNLCNLGESLTYAAMFDQAEECFQRAERLCEGEVEGVRDLRELGRVLTNWGVSKLAQGEDREAGRLLAEGGALSERLGDRRRAHQAAVYRSILQHRQGRGETAQVQLLESISSFFRLKDGRNLVPAIMTLISWRVPDFDGSFEALRCGADDEALQDVIESVLSNERFRIYAEFWRKSFQPLLLR